MKNTFKLASVLILSLFLTACRESNRVNWNIKEKADNFKIKRRVIALNTRTSEALFTVEGLISVSNDSNGDLNVTIKTGEDEYKLFYAHLSDDVTYTVIQLEASETTPYAYEISFFPPAEALTHGLIDIEVSE